MKVYENFISYRRKRASAEVKTLYESLIKRGFTTFCDIYSLTSGDFDKNIDDTIAKCTNFLLVIDQASIDSCSSTNDWLVKEIYAAMKYKKNIILIFIGEVSFKDNIPREIANIQYYNGLKLNLEYFENFIDKLIDKFFLKLEDLGSSDLLRDFIIEDKSLFKYVGNSKHVVIPDVVEEIAAFAFKDSTFIEKVEFNSQLKVIKESAFERCLNLQYLIFPNSLIRIEDKVFSRCFNVSYIEFNSEIEYLGKEAFSFCNKVKKVDLPAALTTIFATAFNNCSQLANISVDENNPRFAALNGILYDKECRLLIKCPEHINTNIIVLPQTVEELGEYSFYKCLNINDIIIPKSLIRVGKKAFKNCVNISKLTLQDQIVDFDLSAIDGWSSEQEIIASSRFNPSLLYKIKNKLKTNNTILKLDTDFKYVLVKTTFESRKEAEAMASLLLDKSLIVSGQLFDIKSLYKWDNKVNEEIEVELSCFTESRLYYEVEKTIKENHSYELCEIVCIPILKTTAEFGDWISSYLIK